jgi:hypothetical protein
MKIALKFAETHNPIFIAGTNLQMKLDVSKRTGMVLVYDRKEKELLLYWNNALAIIPSSNISNMVPADPAALGPIPSAIPATAQTFVAQPVGKVKAQVSDPTRDPVFGRGN